MSTYSFTRAVIGSLFLAVLIATSSTARAGNVFVSGHDSDFHAVLGPNPPGAQNIINRALDFARDGNTAPILFLQSSLANLALGDHADSELGLQASGYTEAASPGQHYVKVNAAGFASANLGDYSAIFVPSDHGGTLTGDDLKALVARSADILAYINAGGGLVAFAEDGFHTPASVGPEAAPFGYLPFLITSTAFTEAENGNTLTPFGSSLGLLTSDINGNFSHNIFTATGGMIVVDRDAAGDILSLAFSGQLGPGGVVPEPSVLVLTGGVLAVLAVLKRK
jgi:hypothetical protein